jgi:hypothetical protein
MLPSLDSRTPTALLTFLGICRSLSSGAFYCFAKLGDNWFLSHEFLRLFYDSMSRECRNQKWPGSFGYFYGDAAHL